MRRLRGAGRCEGCVTAENRSCEQHPRKLRRPTREIMFYSLAFSARTAASSCSSPSANFRSAAGASVGAIPSSRRSPSTASCSAPPSAVRSSSESRPRSSSTGACASPGARRRRRRAEDGVGRGVARGRGGREGLVGRRGKQRVDGRRRRRCQRRRRRAPREHAVQVRAERIRVRPLPRRRIRRPVPKVKLIRRRERLFPAVWQYRWRRRRHRRGRRRRRRRRRRALFAEDAFEVESLQIRRVALRRARCRFDGAVRIVHLELQVSEL